MPRFVLLCALITCGCDAPRRTQTCATSGITAAEPPTLVSLVGERTEVELALPPAVLCPNGNPLATEVVTEVLDALNQPVAHEHSAPTSSNTGGYATRISFTPASPGVHYLTARFEPGLGLARRQHQTARERGDEPPWVRARLGLPCDQVAPLGAVVLCRRGTQVELSRDGVVESREPVLGLATVGEVGWLWTEGRLSRVVELDGGLSRTELSLPLQAGAVAVTRERWVLGADAGFLEVRVGEDGGLAPRRWSVGAAFGPISGASLALEGDVVGWSTATLLCAGAPDAAVACLESPLQALAGVEGALWLRGVDTGVVAQARISADGGVPVVLFIPAQNTALMASRQAHPSFSWNGRLVAPRADDLSFEAWLAPDPVARQAVGDSFVVFQLVGGETVIFKR